MKRIRCAGLFSLIVSAILLFAVNAATASEIILAIASDIIPAAASDTILHDDFDLSCSDIVNNQDTDNQDVINNKIISIIPMPLRVDTKMEQAYNQRASCDEAYFTIDERTKIIINEYALFASAKFLKDYLARYYRVDIDIVDLSSKLLDTLSWGRQVSKDCCGGDDIVLKLSDKGLESEALGSFDDANPAGSIADSRYIVDIDNDLITVEGDGRQGVFYGVQSLIQLLPVDNVVRNPAYNPVRNSASSYVNNLEHSSEGNFVRNSVRNSAPNTLNLPLVRIEDQPAFEYRGMHLDVVRHIWPVEYIKQYIDYLALHKMNYFHIHLTDDQGYRIESKKYPQLNSIGSWRAGTIIGVFPGTGVDSTRYGGFYTVEELKDIVKYAAERYITVVPEIDVPGHSMAIISAFPQFSTTPHIPKQPAITWGIFNRQNNVLAPSGELFSFLRDIFNELMDIFPGKYIHIGADECAKQWWMASESTSAFMQEHGIANLNMLQRYFVEQLSEVMTLRGRVVIGWDEMLDDGLIPGVVVMSWRNAQNGFTAAGLGHKTILTPFNKSYLNVKQRDNEDTLSHKDWKISLEDVYSFNPRPDSLSCIAADNILGGQGCMWTEYFPHRERLEYNLFPRLSAIAEVYWTYKSRKNYSDFVVRLDNQYRRYNLWGANYYGKTTR